MTLKIYLNDAQLHENDAGAVVGTLMISDGAELPLAILSLSSINGSNGFRLHADKYATHSRVVSSAGDVNGDGFDDVIIGDRNTFGGYSIKSYVTFGASSGWNASFDLSSLDGSNGFRLNGGYDRFRVDDVSVSSAGDVNGDGYDDLIIGDGHASPDGIKEAGASYVVFGKSSGFLSDLNLSYLDGSNGFRLDGVDNYERSGASVSNAGDVNGDGYDDMIIGARYDGPMYKSYVVFGKSSGWSASLDLSSLDGSTGFRLSSRPGGIQGFTSVSSAGDVNGDGYDDLIIGIAVTSSDGIKSAGASYVVFGKSSGFSADLDLSSLDGSNGFRLDGEGARTHVIMTVSSAGDVNGDGYDDLIIGDAAASPDGRHIAGAIYVVFGKSSGFSASLQLSSLNGSNGFRLDGVGSNDYSGRSVSSAGDVNGDGYDDLIIGATFASPDGIKSAGASYVVFGKSSGFSASLQLSSLNGSNGFRLDGVDVDDWSGRSVSSAGDVNGDGFDDVIVAANSPSLGTGGSYLVFGGQNGWTSTPSYTLSLTGTDSDHFEIATNNQLKLKDSHSANYEQKDRYSVTVTATVVDSSPVSSDFTFTVTDVYEAPTDIVLSSLTIAENSTAGTVVGGLSAVDPDLGDTHKFAVYRNAIEAAHQLIFISTHPTFEINANNQLVLKSGAMLDYETKASYSITVRATDSGGLSKNQDFTIAVTDVVTEQAPTAVTLNTTTVAENTDSYSTLINGVDPDSEYLTYSITGGTDASSFDINKHSDHLRFASGVTPDYETQSSYSITITATDSGGLSKSQDFTIDVTDQLLLTDFQSSSKFYQIRDLPTDPLCMRHPCVYPMTWPPEPVYGNPAPKIELGSKWFLAGHDAGSLVRWKSSSGSLVGDPVVFRNDTTIYDQPCYAPLAPTITPPYPGNLEFVRVWPILTDSDYSYLLDKTLSKYACSSYAENRWMYSLSSSEKYYYLRVRTDFSPLEGALSHYGVSTGDEARYHSVNFGAHEIYSSAKEVYLKQVLNVIEVLDTDEVVLNNPPTGINLIDNGVISTDYGASRTFSVNVADPDWSHGDPDNQSLDDITLTLSGLAAPRYSLNSKLIIERRSFLIDYDYMIYFDDYLTVTATDKGGFSTTRDFRIYESGFSSAPDYYLDNLFVAENSSGGTHVANISGTDPEGGALNYRIVGGAHAAMFEIPPSGDMLHLATGVGFDYEAENVKYVQLLATDPEGLIYSKSFTISVTDVNEMPTDIFLSNNSLAENSVGVAIGTLSVTDPDKNDTHSLTLYDSKNSTDSKYFEIVNNQLKLKWDASADYETKSSYSVGVTATDSGGLSYSEEFVVKVINDVKDDLVIDDVVNIQEGLYAAQKGNDVYLLSPLLVKANAEITIIDIQDTNKLQLIGGLTIESALLASKTLQLTLSNKAVVTVLDAERFIYETGGDPVVTGTAGVNYSTFNDFTSSVFGKSVPGDDKTIVQAGGAVIQADGRVTDVGLVGIPSIGADEMLALQYDVG